MSEVKRSNAPPRPVPRWTAWPAVSEDGTPMARVKLDVGQYSFQAGSQYDPADEDDFGRRAGNVINAISTHAREQGWL